MMDGIFEYEFTSIYRICFQIKTLKFRFRKERPSPMLKEVLGNFFDRMKSYENQSFQDVKMRQRCKFALQDA